MGKGGKSSASAATRKKKAAKAAAKANAPPPPQRGQKRRTKKEKAQQKKKFVPPQKPPQPPPYPLESMGLASLLPDELVMIFRRAVKKDIVTRIRTMESLLAWINGQLPESEAMSVSERFDALALAIPCWVYLFPRLAMSRSQRLRLLTMQVFARILETPPEDASSPRDELLMPVNIEAILGFFAVIAHDTNRQVAQLSLSLWNSFVSWDETVGKVNIRDYVGIIVEHLHPLLLSDSPAENIALVTPVLQVTSSSDVSVDLDAKARDDANVDESAEALDRRLVAGGLGVLGWLLSSGYTDGLDVFIDSQSVWSSFQSTSGNGVENPQGRAQAWSLLSKAYVAIPDAIEANIATILPAAFEGAWTESDTVVLKTMLPSFLPLLKRHSDAWLDNDDSSDGEDEPNTSPLAGFESWIQTIAPLQPQLCFPTVIVFLSTMPKELLPSSAEEGRDFLAPFFASGDALIRSGLSAVLSGWDAYVNMLCECIVYFAHQLEDPEEARIFAGEHLNSTWKSHAVGKHDTATLPERLWPSTARAVAKGIAALNTTNGVWLVIDAANELSKHSQPSTESLAIWHDQTLAVINDAHSPSALTAVAKILSSPFTDDEVKDKAFGLLVERLDVTKTSTDLTGPLEALSNWHSKDPAPRTERLCTDESLAPALRSVYITAYLLSSNAATALATSFWDRIVATADASTVPLLEGHAYAALESQMWGGEADMERVLAATRALPRAPGTSAVAHTLRVLPDAERMDAALTVAASGAPDSLLWISDPLVSLASGPAPVTDDVAPLVRGIDAFSVAIDADVSLAGEVIWALPYVLFAAMCLEDALLAGNKDMARALAGARKPQEALVRLVQLATRLISRASASLHDDWHTKATATLTGRGEAPKDELYACFASLWTRSANSVQHARVFSRLLHGLLSISAASASDGESWMRIALGKNVPTQLAGAILLATRETARDTRTYDRVRNELVAELGGVTPQRADTEGTRMLALIECATPPTSWGIPLVPVQRAVFALQGIQKWLTSDEELGDDLFTRLAVLFNELAPVVQNATGRVLELMIDTAEENLAAAQLDEHSSWLSLYYTLKLVHTLYTLESDQVREMLAQRRRALNQGIRDVFVALALYSDRLSETQHATVELAVLLAEDLKVDAFASDEHRAALLQALVDPCESQKLHVAVFNRVCQLAQEYVREQVVEMAVAHGESNAELPRVLVEHIAHTPVPDASVWDLDSADDTPRAQFAYLLTWLALLCHFDEASLSLSTSFAQQLHAHTSRLLAGLFKIIGGDRVVRPLDAARIAIDEVLYAELDLQSPRALQALAAHVYLRMLEHLAPQVRDWWLSERDRQLSLYVATFTSKHCSPLLAARELEHIKAPDALSTLNDESMSVKVMSSNEVVATYTIDEYPMEIGVRIPPDFPLHGIEIRDIKRIGVSEAQWRAWLLAVQQLLRGKNGLVLDALTLFKHNVETKFQGYEGAECAICYSIISPTDHTLPNKPCRTCKKRFHGSCLFKWVSTSGASTCPLCRSIL
ncbi:hypothetical protein MCUN1_003143 [Malassezia cuniculi]|uniref:E3 ubiquitin-protein ligase listerin n=1 Tax=Malassezia cuniculi TaxID=948313 RepID=A0AAF0ET30_9BASI|nr:hypothetical protein MCUN1_003143 [Malassezia cuniculi]